MTMTPDLRKRLSEGVPVLASKQPSNRIIQDLCALWAAYQEIEGPLDAVLFCPECGLQHVDAPSPDWDNPPHKSHLCARCRHIWRPLDVATNGVPCLRSTGASDSPPVRGQACAGLVEDYMDEQRLLANRQE